MKFTELIESRYKEASTRTDVLVERWTPFLNGVEGYVQDQRGSALTIHEKRNLAQALDNTFMETAMKSKSNMLSINEATTESDISFLGIQLPVIAALLPSLALNEVALVQTLDRRVGGVFYLDVKYGSDKGGVSADETMIGSKTGHDRRLAGRHYASTHVQGEAIDGSESASGEVVSQQLAYSPGVNLKNGSVLVVDSSNTVIASNADDSVGDDNDVTTITDADGSGRVSGTISSAGLLSLTVDSGYTAPTDGLFVSYDYAYDKSVNASGDRNGVPEANIEVTMDTMTAKDYPIRSQYSIGAAMDLMKAHGISLENEIVKYLGNEVRWSIDQTGLQQIDQASFSAGSANMVTAWNAKIGTGQEWLWKKHELIDRFEEGNINIIDKTLRAVANFVVCGNNVARVIKQLPDFKPVGNLDKAIPTGPVKIGTLSGRTIVQNPFMDDIIVDGSTVQGKNRYVMGFRGPDYLHAGFVYAPYIPLMSTPTLVTSDLYSQKGFLSSAGFKTINQGMFTHGYISDLGTTAVS